MIEIITGVPGSGKSYFAVKSILDLLKSSDNFLILHNIDGLKIDDARLRACDFKQDGFKYEPFVSFLPRLRKDYGLSDEDRIYCFVDEAQRFFPPELKNTEIVYLFDYHRHIGVDFYLITQSIYKVSRKITTLSEQEVRAVNPRINPLGGFMYKKVANGEPFGKFRLKKDKSVFAAYKSFDAGRGKGKVDRKVQFYVLGFVGVAVLAVFLFFTTGIFADGETVRKDRATSLARQEQDPPDPVPYEPPKAPQFENRISKNESVPSRCRPVSPDLPIPEDYFPDSDRVQISKNGRTVQITVSRYLKNYRPINYGYGVMHSPHDRLIIMSEDGRKVLFPEDYADFLNSRPGSSNRQNRFFQG